MEEKSGDADDGADDQAPEGWENNIPPKGQVSQLFSSVVLIVLPSPVGSSRRGSYANLREC